MLDNRTVGKTIAALRQANRMTQQQLAATMNVSHQAVSKWETGQALPDMQTMLDLSRLFGVTIEQLLLGDIPEARLHPREADPEKPQAPAFDLRSAVEGMVNGIGNLFKGPQAKPGNEGTEEPDASEAGDAEPSSGDDAPTAESEEGSQETTADEAEKKETEDERVVLDRIIEMAPFMSRVALEDMLMQYRGRFTPREVAKLAPFVTSATLEALIWRVDGTLDWDLLRRIAPFLQRDVVDRLTWAYMQGEKAVRPAMECAGKAVESAGRALQQKVSEAGLDKLGEQISSGVNQALRSAQKFGESVAREVEKAFAQNAARPEADKPRSEQVRAARRKMFERAMAEDKWDWIAERLDELDDAELKADIAGRAVELGRLDWVNDHFDGFVSDDMVEKAVSDRDWAWLSEHWERVEPELHPELARAAAAEGAWDFLVENINFMDLSGCAMEIALSAAVAGEAPLLTMLAEGHLTEEEALTVAERLLDANQDELLDAVLPHLSTAGVQALCEKLCAVQKWDALEGILPHARESAVDAACLALAEAGEWTRVEAHLDEAGEDTLARLLEMAVDAGNWEAIEAIEGHM